MIRLLIVDDSALMRRLLSDLFEAQADFEVQTARSGAEALERLTTFEPDVVTLDIQMPQMDGLTCLDRLMLLRPTPVVVLSALTAEGAEESVEALELGAVDVVEKPAGPISLEMDAFGPDLVQRVRVAAQARIRRSHRLTERLRARGGATAPGRRPARRVAGAPPTPPVEKARSGPRADGAVLIGVSTGGPPALDAVLSALPSDFPLPVLVAQHMPAAFTGPLARRLDSLCALNVVEVAEAVPLQAGFVYIGRGEADLIVGARPGGPVALAAPSSPEHRWHPSVDRLVNSAVGCFPPTRLIGVLMTGMGDDGAQAMTRLRQGGGRTIAEAAETAVVWGMPGELVRAGGAEWVEPLDRIAGRLLQMVVRP